MTTTNFTVGVGHNSRISSKVLKPPGGETHDIFGTAGNGHDQQRKVHQPHNQSTIFGGDTPVKQRTNGANGHHAPAVPVPAAVSREELSALEAELEEATLATEAMSVSPSPPATPVRPAAGLCAPEQTPKQKYGNGASTIFSESTEEWNGGRQQRKIKDYNKSTVFGDSNNSYAEVDNVPVSRRANLQQTAAPGMDSNLGFILNTPSRHFKQGGGNPITGEGYANGNGNGPVNVTSVDQKDSGPPAAGKKVPPGGYSSRLW